MSGNKRALTTYTLVDEDPEDLFALEKDILAQTKSGRFSLVVYSWSYPVIILGYNQSTGDVDIPAAISAHMPVVRRSTGGTGIIHHRDIGVSLALPMYHPWAKSIGGLYHENRETLARTLRHHGIETAVEPSVQYTPAPPLEICFLNNGNDGLYFGGKRFMGSAQSRRHYGVLIHSHIHLSMRDDLYSSVFNVELEIIKKHMISAPLFWEDREKLVYSIITTYSNRLKMNPAFEESHSGKRRLNPPTQLELPLHTLPDVNSSPHISETETCGV